jgi:PilZ domain
MSIQDVMKTNKLAIPKRPPSNRRASVRYHCGLATAGQVEIAGQEWQRAWVLDLSIRGVGLLVNRVLEPGLEVVIHLKCPGAQQSFALPSRIRHVSRQADGEWILGCEFDGKLTDDQLELLLQ